MTTTSDAPIDTSEAPPVTITPEADTRLDQLAAEYAALKPFVDEYVERLEAVKSALKAELQQAAPDATKVTLSSSYLPKPLQLSAVTSWRFDSRKLKTEDPHTWVRYAKQSTSWRLEAAK